MRDITEAEIVAAAKAFFGTRRLHWTWETAPIQFKWFYLARAYAVLRAAKESMGK